MTRARVLADFVGGTTTISGTPTFTGTVTGAGAGTASNLIINGAMQVAQRSASTTVGDSATYKTLDRFAISINGTTAGRATMSQATDAPSGFGNSMKFDVTTADTSIAADEAFGFAQRIEGQNLQQLAKGTSDAKVCTLSFYAKGTAKTYIVETRDANSRQVSATFDVTTSWQRFEIEIPADTTGTIANDNSTELQIIWWLHAGSDYTSGTLNTSWATSTNANRMVGCDSIFDSTSNELFITGVQFELGETATPFEHEGYGTTLRKCQRYFQKIESLGSVAAYNAFPYTGLSRTATIAKVSCGWITILRSAPTMTFSAASDFAVVNGSGSAKAVTAISVIRTNNNSGVVEFTATGLTAGQATYLTTNNATDPAISVDAEL